MTASQDFPGEQWFLHIVANWTEGPRLDFKQGLLKLYANDKELKNWGVTEKKGDLIKKGEAACDITAFANVARRTGKPCWMVFGVNDKDRSLFYDLRNEYPTRQKPKHRAQFKQKSLTAQQEEIAQQYRNLAKEWIEPVPRLQYDFGEVNGKLVACLKILPSPQKRPFRLKKDAVKVKVKKDAGEGAEKGVKKDADAKERVSDKERRTHPAGTAFIRYGESTVPVDADGLDELIVSRIPYLAEDAWKQMIAPLQQNLVFENARASIREFPILDENNRDALAVLLNLLNSNRHHIAVVGPAGSGKSVLLHALAYELAMRHNLDNLTYRKYFAQKIADEDFAGIDNLEVVPRHPVPVFVHLRGRFDTLDVFKQTALAKMGLRASIDTHTDYTLDDYFRIPNSRWILILDALDEVQNLEKSFGPSLAQWLKLLPENVQVVISQRPVVEHGADSVVQIAKLSTERCKALLRIKQSSLVAEHGIEESEVEKMMGNAIDLLDNHQEMHDVLFSPRAVDGLVYSLMGIDPSISLEEEEQYEKKTEATSPGSADGNDGDSENNDVTESVDPELPFVREDEAASARGEPSDDGMGYDDDDTVEQYEKVSEATLPGSADGDDRDFENDNVTESVDTELPFVREDEAASAKGEPSDDGMGYDDDDTVEEDIVADERLPSFATLYAQIVDYIREKEKERQKIKGLDPDSALDKATGELEELAWEKNWQDEVFTWRGRWKRILSDPGLQWNSYLGLLNRVRNERFRFLSLRFMAFCAANYGARGVIENYLNEDDVVDVIREKQQETATKQVRDLLTHLLRDNGREISFQVEEV